MTVEIPLKRKYRISSKSSYKGGHNNGAKKRGDGWSKHKWGKGINHIPYAVGLDLNRGGKTFKRPAYADEVPASIFKMLSDKGVELPQRPKA